MRYLVSPRLWALLAIRHIDHATLADHTPHTQQWVSYVYCHAAVTVSAAWAEGVCAFLKVPLSSYFTVAPPREQRRSESESIEAA